MEPERRRKTTVVKRTERRSPCGKLLSTTRSKEVYYENEERPHSPTGLSVSQFQISPPDTDGVGECRGKVQDGRRNDATSLLSGYDQDEERSIRESRTRAVRTESREVSPPNRVVKWASKVGHTPIDGHESSSFTAPHLLHSTGVVSVLAKSNQWGTSIPAQILAQLNDIRRASQCGPALLADEYLMLRARTIALRIVLESDTRAFDEEKRRGCAIVLWIGPLEDETHSHARRVIDDWLRELESREPRRRNYLVDGGLRKVGVAGAQFITHPNYRAIVAMFE